ncbi:MAG: sensor histidine kinase, partial [Bryobacteraceae bacterium]
MSLRIRLVLAIVALVAAVAVALGVLHLDTLVNSLSSDALQRSDLASHQVESFLSDQIYKHSVEYAPPATAEERVALWNQIVTSDQDIPPMLEKLLGLSPAMVEINVAGQTGQILASSNPSRIGAPLGNLGQLAAWRNGPLYRRLTDLVAGRPDYQVTVPVGVGDQQIFTIQVVDSSVLLRSALMPQIEWLALVSIGALLISLLLTALAANWVLRPLRRIERTIDRIVQGSYQRDEQGRAVAKEFAAVESKLNMLGEKFRGAREEATEMHHNVEQLLERMASQLDVASRLAAISRISGGVAHEIKNPLNAISLRLDLLRARLGAPEEELTGEIDILSNEVRRLDRVVKTFLDFSRPVEVRLEQVDLAALAREVGDLMSPPARLAGIALSCDAPEGDASIRGDADLLKQAVLNLVTNAIDAMKQGGQLRLGVTRLRGAVLLEVADNGPGIPSDQRELVFDRFVRLEG